MTSNIDAAQRDMLRSLLRMGSVYLCGLVLLFASGMARADSAQYFYDPAGRLTGMVDPTNGSATYAYDAVGNILSVVRKPISNIMVAEVSPSRGAAGSRVTIAGTGFGTTSNTTVSFNGTAATVSSVTSTLIVVSVPAGAKTGPVSVTSPVGTASSTASYAVLTGTAPTVASFSPAQVDQGSTLTITGTGFDPNAANDKVRINGRFTNVTAATATSLTVVVPASTTGPVSVTTSQGAGASSANVVVPPIPYLASQIGSVSTGAVGQSSTVSVNNAGQVALVIVPLQAGQRLSLYVPNSSFGSATAGLYGPDGSALIPSFSLSSGTSTGTVVIKTTAFYTIVAAPGSGQTGSATLSLLADLSSALTIDGPTSTLTNTAGQNIVLSFTGAANQKVTLLRQITSGSLSGCSPVRIFQPDGVTSIFYNADCDWYQFSDTIVLPVTGSYTIAFDPADSQTGTVNFTLQSVAPDVTSGITIDGGIVSLATTTPGQNMALTFSGAANQRISFLRQVTAGNLSGCSPSRMLQPDGITTLYYGQDCDWHQFSDVIVLPTSGTYTIFYNPGGSTTGTVSFSLQSVPPDVNSSIAIDGGSVSVTTTKPGQNMMLSFSGTAGQRFTLSREVTSGNLAGCSAMQILQPDGSTPLYSNSFCSQSLFSDVLTLPSSGSYKIIYDPGSDTIGTASFTLQSVPPDVVGAIVVDGAAVSLTTTRPGQNMSLNFSGSANQKVTLSRQVTAGNLAGCSGLRIFQPDGVTTLYYNDFCSQTLFSDVLVLPVTGTYRIFYDPDYSSTGTASFSLRSVPPNASATITPGGGLVGVTTGTPGQNVTLNFLATAGRRIGLLTQFDGNLSRTCNSIQILNPDGVGVLYSSSGCSSADFSGVLPRSDVITSSVPSLAVTGTYQIALNPGDTSVGTTSFTLYDVPPDIQGSATVGAASIVFTTDTPGQAIRVSFPGSANSSASVNVNVSGSTQSSCFRVTVLAPDGTTTLRGDQSCSNSYSSGSLGLPANGSYTVVVSPGGTMTGSFAVGVTSP